MGDKIADRVVELMAALVLVFISLLLVWGCVAVCAQIAALIA